MTPAARVAAAIGIIDDWQAGDAGLDRVLTAWGRSNRYAGSGDRHAIADLVYSAVRRLRSACWFAGSEAVSGRAALIGSALLDRADPETLFTGDRHAPAPLTSTERAAMGRTLHAAPRGVRLDLPDWLLPHLEDVPEGALAALRDRAALDLRVNRLKGDPAAAVALLAEDGVEAEPGPLVSDCLRVTAGARKVVRTRAYLDGLVEIQDAASQAAAAFADARPGETALDFCAGGGGKTLALAAAMAGQGRLIAHDASAARLAALPARAERAGARAEIAAPGEAAAYRGACDLVFVDAPCSGSGAWRRNPDAKWRLTEGALAALRETQAAVLDEAAAALAPGGRLVYATCSLLASENAGTVEAFLATRPGFRRAKPDLVLRPGIDGGDGFFAAMLVRN